jgi:hypothetical protein
MAPIQEKMLPVEELAARRLTLMVTAYTMLLKHLKQEGVELEKVKAASDRTWQVLGDQAGAELKPLFEGVPVADMATQTGTIATEIHGMAIAREVMPGAHRTDFETCPWNETADALEMPEAWRLCHSGHDAFVKAMYHAIDPQVSVGMDETASQGAICSETVRY